MDFGVDDLVAELKAVRKGRGIESTDIDSRIGPALRWAAGVPADDGPEQLRSKVRERLIKLVGDLPDDLRLATSAAFGLHAEVRLPTLSDRVTAAGKLLDRDARTVKRRIDDGTVRIAELALAGAPQPARSGPPWRTEELRAALVLDLPIPEVIETRRIVAERDGLAEVELTVTLANSSDIGLDVLYGGVVTSRVMKSTNRLAFVLRLPRPLRRGEEHEYAFRIRLTTIKPHYVCTPRYPCASFRLHVRFGERVPDEIWLLDNVLALEVDDPLSAREAVRADASGEVHAVFTELEPNLSYGVAWRAASDDRTPS